MNDREFIIYLCEQIWDVISDGNEPDIDTIVEELRNRGIDPDEVFIY